MKRNDYPYWAYPSYKQWLKKTRKRWNILRKEIKISEIETGCVYLPTEVYTWLNQFKEIDRIMKNYYKNV